MDDNTYDKIRSRAFELFEARNRDGATGDPMSDWLQAEREVLGSERSEEDSEPHVSRSPAPSRSSVRRAPVRQAR